MLQVIWPDTETQDLENHIRGLCPYATSEAGKRVVAVVPLYTEGASGQIAKIDKECRENSSCISLHIIGLRSSLSTAVSGHKVQEHGEKEHKSIKMLPSLTLNELNTSYSLIDDFNINGEQIGFTTESLADFLSIILSALARNYDAVIHESTINNIAFGAGAIRYDLIRSIDRCFHKCLAKALENAGFCNIQPNNTLIESKAHAYIGNTDNLYLKFYQEKIIHPYRDGMDANEVIAQAENEIKAFFDDLLKNIEGIFKDNSLTFPEKAAILARILSTDTKSLGEEASSIYSTTDTDFATTDEELAKLNVERQNLTAKIELLGSGIIRNRRKRRELNEALLATENQLTRLRNDRDEAYLSYTIAKTWLDYYNEFLTSHGEFLQKITEFNRVMAERSRGIAAYDNSVGENRVVQILRDDTLLDAFFSDRIDRLAATVDYQGALERFICTGLDLPLIQSDIEQQIRKSIASLFDSFSLAEYLMGQDFPYIARSSLDNELERLVSDATPACRNSAPELPEAWALDFIGVEPERLRTWKAATEKIFPSETLHISVPHPAEIVFVKVQPIPLDYCI